MSIGERIVFLRKKHNISQGDLAEALDITRQAVSKWENDLSSPDTLNLIKLADVLDTDVEYLATGKEPAPLPIRPPVIIEKIVEVDKFIEVEKKVTVEKPVVLREEVPVEIVVEKPVFKKIVRVKYIRNPLEFLAVGIIGALIGFVSGILF